ncbi:hypothetical protein SAMN04488057_12165 [Cyclobacterium lianum]|uniref:Uncharacterized protein n=1 Tax=Cyclobacterium lianum TaxID=388280 RepID=A0A1M7QQF7_9BACT|nr:hypothetical protein [Cyclobacterium lianum]SHN33458.1 hypothetical protein SAMN04488057_12165 [Cyclobacterium lianum]
MANNLIILTPDGELVESTFAKIEKSSSAKNCVGNACDCIHWRLDSKKKIKVMNQCNSSVEIHFKFADMLGGCGSGQRIKVFPNETYEFQMPTHYLGICMPVTANKI